ncbi:MAG TPA: sucrase ferredoxin [Streptosporangiaceae bacterium]
MECEHGAESHDGTLVSAASAPEGSRAWLLIEHPGPWPAEAADAELPAALRALVNQAVEHGVRVQMIRRPGHRGQLRDRAVFAGWTAGRAPWLRRLDEPTDLDVAGLSRGESGGSGRPVAEAMFLVCGHAQRNACCARFGGPLAQELAVRYPRQTWQTTHVGGHRFAANLVILPHGLYYGPVGLATAMTAIGAYERGDVMAERYRGRAGQPHDVQEAEHDRLAAAGSLPFTALA